ncbi:MAG TPA: tyrosine-protein phosphatase [Streptosporangiaceae bacterium]|jgi:protein-tyrosine phosphatase
MSIGHGERLIALPGAFNLRDVGGYPAAGGRVTRWRTLLRSGSLHLAGPAGAAELARFGLRTVVDLRTFEEAERSPDPALGAAQRRVGLLGEDLAVLPVSLDGVYRFVISERGSYVGAAVRHLCAPGALPALVHCSAGKDRTGLIIALVLAAIGVPDDVLAADYALSADALGRYAAAAVGQLRAVMPEDGDPHDDPEDDGLGLDLGPGNDRGLPADPESALLDSPPELILSILAQVRASDGDSAGYLARNGVPPAALAALRDAVTEPE